MEKRKFIKKSERKLILITSLFIRVYIKAISPLSGPRCRFSPSCSNYFLKSLRAKGFIKGFAAGTWRIVRCNPFCPGGYDPVKTGKE